MYLVFSLCSVTIVALVVIEEWICRLYAEPCTGANSEASCFNLSGKGH